MPARFRLAFFGRAAVLFVLATALGCSQGDGRVAVHPVEGQLTWNGQPLPNAFVVLHPKDPTDTRVLPARAQTDAAGKFQVTTYEQADGAAVGEYKVTVEFYRPIKNGSGFEPGPNVLPPKLARPDTSEISVRVAEGKNTLEPISLR
jgi:hypothetical protein